MFEDILGVPHRGKLSCCSNSSTKDVMFQSYVLRSLSNQQMAILLSSVELNILRSRVYNNNAFKMG